MKIVRVKHDDDIFYGELIDEKIIRYEGSPFVVWEETEAVSYTHLTLPTICSV